VGRITRLDTEGHRAPGRTDEFAPEPHRLTPAHSSDTEASAAADPAPVIARNVIVAGRGQGDTGHTPSISVALRSKVAARTLRRERQRMLENRRQRSSADLIIVKYQGRQVQLPRSDNCALEILPSATPSCSARPADGSRTRAVVDRHGAGAPD